MNRPYYAVFRGARRKIVFFDWENNTVWLQHPAGNFPVGIYGVMEFWDKNNNTVSIPRRRLNSESFTTSIGGTEI